MILSETIELFISGGEKDLEERMKRACLCDLEKLTYQINKEINALPPKKKKIIKETIMEYFNDFTRGDHDYLDIRFN